MINLDRINQYFRMASATDLLTLGETLEFLADGGAAPQAQVLPGSWSEDGKRYAFSDDTLAAVQALFSTEASSGASSGRSGSGAISVTMATFSRAVRLGMRL